MDCKVSPPYPANAGALLANLVVRSGSTYPAITDIAVELGPFRGMFRLGGMALFPRSDKPPSHSIRLTDATGTLDCYG